MAEKTDKKEQEVTTAQGADSASVNETEQSKDNVQTGSLQAEIEAPEWAVRLESKLDQVLEAIGQFNENAEHVVKDIIAEAKSVTPAKVENKEIPAVKINKKAKYVVAKGQKFQSAVSGSMITEGTDVTGFESERLQKLLAQGIVVEAD